MPKKEVNCKWMLTDTEYSCMSDALLLRLLRSDRKIVVLDGYSGCGKTTMLRRLKAESSRAVHIFSDEQFVQLVLERIVRKNEENEMERLASKGGQIICIEDVDLYVGKYATQNEFSFFVKNAAKQNLVILTGNYMTERVDYLLELLDAEHWYTERELPTE